jgi:purine-nucleoside phosphorylase
MVLNRGKSDLTALTAAVLDRAGPEPFDLAVVLGSGLGDAMTAMTVAGTWSYGDFSCFPAGTVAGHAGKLVAGCLEGRRLLLFQGRFHLYQGLTARQVVAPVEVAYRLGCRRLLLTNAVGGIRPDLDVGHFMFIDDHINLLGDNPLRGLPDPPFIDLCHLYRTDLFSPLHAFAITKDITLRRGVLAAVPGPSYETPAEVRALSCLGADAVSMSTIPEAIMARYLGMEVVGISFVANRAAGLAQETLSHAEVLAAGRRGASAMAALIGALCHTWCS